VIKAFSGAFRVRLDGDVVLCRPRGRLKKEGVRILVGDRVRLEPAGDGTWVISGVEPRRTELFRPPVANVDRAVVVASVRQPDLDLRLVDRQLVLAAAAGLDAVLCLNKADLAAGEDIRPVVETYRKLGYPVVVTSARRGDGIEDLRASLGGGISVFAGPSGVGKSTLLNALVPGFRLHTAPVSDRLRRGTHTTRHVELLPVPGAGLVADTPGFTQVELRDIAAGELGRYFPEFLPLAPECRFRGCLHRHEPDCAVKAAVKQGRLDAGRYERYLQFLSEIEAAGPAY